MKLKIQLFLLSAAALFVSACGPSASVDTVASNTVQSSQIYQDYRVSSDRSGTRITAVFRVGGSTGTTVELTAPGKILYNGAEMNFSPPGGIMNVRTKGTTYEASLQNYEAANSFEYTDANGKKYTNAINLAPIQFAAQKPPVLQKTGPSTITLSRPVNADEKLFIADDDGPGDEIPTKNGSVTFSPGRSALIIKPQFWLTKPVPAKVQLKIRIHKTGPVTQATATGGSMSVEYTAAPLVAAVNKSGKPAANTNTTAADANSTAENTADETAVADANANKIIKRPRRNIRANSRRKK